MVNYTIQRILLVVPTFIGITVVTFIVIHLAPGEPTEHMLDNITPRPDTGYSYDQLRSHFGLDQPLYVQYGRWLRRVLSLDFGRSFSDHRLVWHKIRERLPWTLWLTALSIVFSFALSIPIGIVCAARRNKWFDMASGTALYALYSIPSYVMGTVLILGVVSLDLTGLGIRGAYSDTFSQMSVSEQIIDVIRHSVLITVCFVYPALAYQSRFLRHQMLEVLGDDHIRTGTAKGLTESQVVIRHALPNALIPLITLLGLTVPTLLGGSVILEVMFNWPGIGRLLFESMSQRDYPTVMALTVISAVVVQGTTLLADLSYAVADPRVRYGRR